MKGLFIASLSIIKVLYNELLGSNFDAILDLFSEQYENCSTNDYFHALSEITIPNRQFEKLSKEYDTKANEIVKSNI